MCVICYIPKEAEELSYNDLKKMWDKNPDGAGIMWLENGVPHFKKGYFNFNVLYRDYLVIKRDNNFECALHFRIATSGGINEKMCHPFIMTNKENVIVKTKGVCDTLMMHNGIIPINNRIGFSDTAEYVMSILYPRFNKDKKYIEHMDKTKILGEIGYSKLLFFSRNGIEMVGSWKKYKGCYCSNLYFDNSSSRYYYEDSYSTYKPTFRDTSYFEYCRDSLAYNDDYEKGYDY